MPTNIQSNSFFIRERKSDYISFISGFPYDILVYSEIISLGGVGGRMVSCRECRVLETFTQRNASPTISAWDSRMALSFSNLLAVFWKNALAHRRIARGSLVTPFSRSFRFANLRCFDSTGQLIPGTSENIRWDRRDPSVGWAGAWLSSRRFVVHPKHLETRNCKKEQKTDMAGLLLRSESF